MDILAWGGALPEHWKQLDAVQGTILCRENSAKRPPRSRLTFIQSLVEPDSLGLRQGQTVLLVLRPLGMPTPNVKNRQAETAAESGKM